MEPGTGAGQAFGANGLATQHPHPCWWSKLGSRAHPDWGWAAEGTVQAGGEVGWESGNVSANIIFLLGNVYGPPATNQAQFRCQTTGPQKLHKALDAVSQVVISARRKRSQGGGWDRGGCGCQGPRQLQRSYLGQWREAVHLEGELSQVGKQHVQGP